jgi:hypothetical protein
MVNPNPATDSGLIGSELQANLDDLLSGKYSQLIRQLLACQDYKPNTLPMVWIHRSGRKSLVLASTASHVVDMDKRESTSLLTRLHSGDCHVR